MKKPYSLRFIFGFRSPYAWLANRFFDQKLATHEQNQISYIPFWNPAPDTADELKALNDGFLYREMSKQRHLYILRDIKRLAAQFGESILWPTDLPDQDWEKPHCLYLKASTVNKSRQARELIYSARWKHGLNICDPVVLQKIAAELGVIDFDDLPLSRRVEPLQSCYRDQVFGLPFFVVGREKFWGLDRLPFALRAAGFSSCEFEKIWFAGPQHAEAL